MDVTYMNLNDYQIWTRTTAIYPVDQALEYLGLGLTNEAGEVAGKLKKRIRDGDMHENEVIAELGDTLWYLTRLADEYGVSIEELAYLNYKKLESRKARGMLKGSGDNR